MVITASSGREIVAAWVAARASSAPLPLDGIADDPAPAIVALHADFGFKKSAFHGVHLRLLGSSLFAIRKHSARIERRRVALRGSAFMSGAIRSSRSTAAPKNLRNSRQSSCRQRGQPRPPGCSIGRPHTSQGTIRFVICGTRKRVRQDQRRTSTHREGARRGSLSWPVNR